MTDAFERQFNLTILGRDEAYYLRGSQLCSLSRRNLADWFSRAPSSFVDYEMCSVSNSAISIFAIFFPAVQQAEAILH